MRNGEGKARNLRSQLWFDDPHDPGMTALYLERYLNYGLSRKELQSGRPIIGIAQTGNDLAPCNRHHLDLAERVKEGIRDAGGVGFEFPVHTIQETGKRPTAALDRNLAYLGLVEVLYGYPLDGVVLTTGCDKTTPACLMAAATVNIPAIVLSGGPMLNGWWKGKRAGSGTVVWEARLRHAAGEIDYDEFMDIVASSAPSPVFIRPPGGHAPHDGQSFLRRTAAVFAGLRLSDAQLRMLAAAPMDRKDDLARVLVDVGDDVRDEGAQKLLAGAHRHAGRVPGRFEIVGQAREIRRLDGRCRRQPVKPCFAGFDPLERGFPALLKLGGDQTMVGIARRIAAFGQQGLVPSLLQLEISDALSFVSAFHPPSLSVQRGLDGHRFHDEEDLPRDRRLNPRAAESQAPGSAQHLVGAIATIDRPA